MGEDKEQPKDQDVSFFKILRSVVSQLRPGQDITRIRLPSNLCYPFTLLEFIPMKRMRGMSILKDYEGLTDPVEKMLCMLKWYLCCVTEDEYGKKPLNPVVGESFICESGTTLYASEQVSHHPPISAFCFVDDSLKFRFEGHMELQAKFSANSVAATTKGVCRITIGGDVYTFNKFMPTLHCRNLIMGTSRNEYGGEIELECGDLVTKLDFRLQPKLGRYNLHYVKGDVVRKDAPKKSLAHLEGHWHTTVAVTFPQGNGDGLSLPFVEDGILYNFEDIEAPQIDELRCEQQDDKASGQVWAEATAHIRAKEWELANEAKTSVENEQRSMLEALEEDGEEVPTKFFRLDEETDMWLIIPDAYEDILAARGGGKGKDKKKKKKKKGKKGKKDADADADADADEGSAE